MSVTLEQATAVVLRFGHAFGRRIGDDTARTWHQALTRHELVDVTEAADWWIETQESLPSLTGFLKQVNRFARERARAAATAPVCDCDGGFFTEYPQDRQPVCRPCRRCHERRGSKSWERWKEGRYGLRMDRRDDEAPLTADPTIVRTAIEQARNALKGGR